MTDDGALDERGPIVIRGDANFTSQNGVRSGSGTQEDPYVIRGWRITGTSNYGVYIRDTTKSWIVEEVLVDGGAGAAFRDGFWIVNVTGGEIRHVEARSMPRYGIYLGNATGTVVSHSAVRSNGFVGLYAHRSTGLLWEQNVGNGNFKHGFYLANRSTNNRITLSESFDHLGDGNVSFGIYTGIGADHNLIDNNTLHNNGAGIQVNLVAHNVIRDNVVTASAARGISITQSTDTLVAANTVHDSVETGILLAQSERITVEHNDIVNNTLRGIEVRESGGHVIRHNHVRSSEVGIRFAFGATGNLVFDNLFSNAHNAADSEGGNTWNVSKQAGRNILGGLFVGGNYWSDITEEYHDHDEDGLAESHGPYAVGIAEGGDLLPLVGAPGGPQASFAISNQRPYSFERVEFIDTSAMGDRPIVNYTWEFHDGLREYARRVTREYATAGDFTVTLRVQDSAGLTSTMVARVYVQNLLPVPRLAGPSVIATTGAVTLDARASSDADGYLIGHEWTLGDDAVASGIIVSHAYATEGTYAGSLLVIDDKLGSRALGFTVLVDRHAPSTQMLIEGERGNGDWIRGGEARLIASDDRAGVLRSEWRSAEDDPWGRFEDPITLPEGIATIRYRSIDLAGNIEDDRVTLVRVDGMPPTTTYVGPALVGPTTPIALRASDATSGPARTFYTLPGESGARVYTGPFTLSTAPEGNVTLTVWSEDAAGNVEPARSVPLRLDRTPPELAIVSPAAWSVTILGHAAEAEPPDAPEELPTVAFVIGWARIRTEAHDPLAGVARVRVSAGDEVLLDAASGFESVNWTVAPGAPEVEIIVDAWDAVGNHAVARRTVHAVAMPLPTDR